MKWTIRELIKTTTDYLRKKGIDEPRLTTELLLSHSLGMKRVELYLNFDKPLSDDELDTFREFIKRRLAHEPVQYIVGSTGFMGLEFETKEGAFIPRQETEILVSVVKLWVESRNLSDFVLYDIGTGTGAIAISIAHFFPKARIYASDISEIAIECARRNASLSGAENRITFLAGNLFLPFAGIEKADVIASNPPYIPAAQIEQLPEIVKREPIEALIAGKDGLDVIGRLVEAAGEYLQPQGLLAFEIGINQAEPIASLLEKANYENIKFVPDLRGIKRVAVGVRS
jgi:release factor glutamine methyltransferase